MLERPGRRRPRPSRLRQRAVRIATLAVLLVLAFMLGIAFARALDEGPRPGDVVTTVRTLTALEEPSGTDTTTVTVTQP